MPPQPAVAGRALARGDAAAWRTVHGRPLAEAIADYRRAPSPLGLYDLLRPFVAACYDVAYAHGRGMVHLGLTPRHILLGEFAETAVVGWDRARPPSSANGEADAYAAAFLAPEQITGPAEKVGPASDVYALGAILYAILTGEPPYAGATAADVLSRVRQGLAWQPRMVAGGVHAALEAVCLTAMEREPADRYPLAAALAREVERWMAGERVRTNYVEPRGVRLVRWARSRRGLWVLGALAALGLTALPAFLGLGMVIDALQTERTQAREESARDREQLEQAAAGLRKSREYVEAASHQRALAAEEFAAAVQALHALALKAQPRPGDGPTLAAYKADLLRTALDGARQLALRADHAADTDLAAGQDHIKLGELFAALGQPAEVRRHYERALAIARPAAATYPDNLLAQRDLALAARGLGQVCLQQGQASLARDLGREAQAAAQRWAKVEPNNVLVRRQEVACLALTADACVALHDLPAARAATDTMSATAEQYANADPKNVLGRLDLATTRILRGRVEQLDYNFAEALRCYDLALGILRPLKENGKLKPLPQESARLEALDKEAEECRSILRTIDDINVALREPPETALRWLTRRAGALARRGRAAEAAATAEKMRQLRPLDAVNLYNVACCYALCVPAVGMGKPAEALTPEEKASRADYAARAQKDLRAAADHGFRNLEKIESDPDLDSLRSEAGYRALVAELKALRAWLTVPVLP
jgi:hypothetical protein